MNINITGRNLKVDSNLSELIQREFSSEGDIEEALKIVRDSKAIYRARQLAENFAMGSYESIKWIPDSPSKRALLELPEYVLGRLY